MTEEGVRPSRDSDAIAALLTAVFSDDGAASRFVVLRNDEDLPTALSGTDLDVSVLPGSSADKAADYVIRCARRVGWEAACISSRPHMIALAVVAASGEDTKAALHFDIFDGITYHGIPLVDPATLKAESFVRGSVRYLSDRGKVLATVAHHVAWNGGLAKQKYREQLSAVLRHEDDRRWLHAQFAQVFGVRVARELTDQSAIDQLGQHLRRRRKRAAAALLGTHIRRRPVATVARVGRYLIGQLRSFVTPPGIVGAEGSRLPSVPRRTLSLELACNLSPHGFRISHGRANAGDIATLNGERYALSLRRTWSKWAPVRLLAPSVFFWFQAKRGRVVVVDRLPLTLRLLQYAPRRPRWVAMMPRERTR